MKINNRLSAIEEYHFKKIDYIKEKLISKGINLVDLGIGDPDLPVNECIVKALIKSLELNNFNNYPPYEGIIELKKEIINYYKNIYSVSLNEDEVIILIGSKEGINNMIPAVCNIGDTAILPNPSYPVYNTCCKLWGVETYTIPLNKYNNYLPKLQYIPKSIVNSSKLFIINYPNNPTGAVANEEFYKDIINFCNNNDIVLCNDGAYNEIVKHEDKPLSILKYDKDKTSVEFGSFSKIYNMTGFRLGYAVGNAKVIKALSKVKSNVDSGQFVPIQMAGVEALRINQEYHLNIRKIYDERREAAEKILQEKGIEFFNAGGTFYLWCKVPFGYTTDEFCQELIENYGIIVTPGYTFGYMGSDFFRIALTKEADKIKEALERLKCYK